jgi:Undecaprenyl-phosphate glucose phosphotransferase
MTSPYAGNRASAAALASTAYSLSTLRTGTDATERRQGPPAGRRRTPQASRGLPNKSGGRRLDDDVRAIPSAAEAPTPVANNNQPELRRHRLNPRVVGWAVGMIDRVILVAAGIGAYLVQPEFHRLPDPRAALIALAVGAIAWRTSKGEQGLVRDAVRQSPLRFALEAMGRMLTPLAICLAVLAMLPSAGEAAHRPLVAWLALWAAAAAIGVAGTHVAAAQLIQRAHREGLLKQAVAIFGTGDLAERLLERLHATCSDAIELVGIFDDRRRVTNGHLHALVCGTANDLIELSRRRMIDRVIVALPHSAERRLVEVLHKLHRMPVEISLAPDMVGFSVASRDSTEFGGLPLIDVYGKPLSFGQNLAKDIFDKVVGVLALIVAGPVMLACALAIKLDSKGPVLFSQNRLGFGDRVIRVLKFRTMYAEASDHNGETQSSRDDPRITRVGRFLRRSSLDELPQLFNVLRGEMSLVGPRPHAVAMHIQHRRNEDIVPDYALRHHVKPGITGWAQVNGHNGPVSTEEALRARVAHDLDYINNWSLWFDLRSLVMTVKLFLRQRPVY